MSITAYGCFTIDFSFLFGVSKNFLLKCKFPVNISPFVDDEQHNYIFRNLGSI